MAIQYFCKNLQRKSRIRDTVNTLNGIDYLEVLDGLELDTSLRQKRLFIHFIKPDNLPSLINDNIRIDGGSRIKQIKVTSLAIHASLPEVLIVDVDRYGDFSLYTLRVVKGAGDLSPPDWLDPILSTVEFSFKVACPSDFDCQQQIECPPETPAEPEIDYLAKDYASFQQLMLDRLATIIPAWQERNPADVGMAAVEVLAYAGDHLSYYQDAVATEAYLGTARRRVSMRRHARLLDYAMHEGCNARTWVVLNASDNADNYMVPAHTPLLTRGPRPAVTEVGGETRVGPAPDDPVQLAHFVLLAGESLLIEASSQIHRGHVGVNLPAPMTRASDSDGDDDIEWDELPLGTLHLESKAHVSDRDSSLFADRLIIDNGARVTRVVYGSSLDNDGVIEGETISDYRFPLFDSLPVVPTFSPGSSDIEVDKNEHRTLVPGDYGELEAERSARITFSGGVYNFQSWKLERNVRLMFSAPTEIRIEEKLETNAYVRINLGGAGAGGGDGDGSVLEAGPLAPEQVVIYVKGTDDHGDDDDDDDHEGDDSRIKFGYSNQIRATVFAPGVNLLFRDRVHVTGTFYGRRITTGNHGQFFSDLEASPGQDTRDSSPRLCIENISEGMHVFETLHPITLHHQHNSIEIYTWGDEDCCLPAGATRASLNNEGNRLQHLQTGDLLLFEEILGGNGRPEDADQSHRHVVRLSRIEPTEDPLYEEPIAYSVDGEEKTALRILNIEWALEDALPFALCLQKTVPGNIPADDVLFTLMSRGEATPMSVARGNVVLADHGRTLCNQPLIPATVPAYGQTYRPRLGRGPLTFHDVYLDEFARTEPASGLLIQDVRQGLADLHLSSSNGETWLPQWDLLNSGRFAPEFVIEMEDDGRAWLRFGDSVLGKRPAPGLTFSTTYRVGSGVAGNIGAESLVQILLPKKDLSLESEISVRNPLAAQGGTDPETIEQVRLYAPQAFRSQKRAVTPADYAAMTEQHSQVQKAVAIQRWTGSWHTVFITIDRKGGREVDAAFEAEIRDHLEPLRMMGHDIEVEAPRLVPLDVAFKVCVQPEYLKSKVKEELLEVFSIRELADGQLGFFHPDNFTFGQAVSISQVVAAAMQVPGVHWVDPLRFQRLGESTQIQSPLIRGLRIVKQSSLPTFLHLGRLEIARLDNDPNAPENGKLEFVMEGGL